MGTARKDELSRVIDIAEGIYEMLIVLDNASDVYTISSKMFRLLQENMSQIISFLKSEEKEDDKDGSVS